MTESLGFRSHIHYSIIWHELDTFRDIAAEGDYELSIMGFKKYVYERFFHDLKPFWEFTLDEVVDEDDFRYPSEKWLASIYEIGRSFCLKEAFKHGDILLSQIQKAWFFGYDEDIFHFNEETKELVAYTSGWSGCEDIIYVLSKAFPLVEAFGAELHFDMRYLFPKEAVE